METHVLDLLAGTLVSDTATIRKSEAGLANLHSSPDFPVALLNIASSSEVDLSKRKASLTTLKNYVSAVWSLGPAEGQATLPDDVKQSVREQIFALSTAESGHADGGNNIQALAANVVRAIANIDFPDAWPGLLQTVLHILQGQSSNAQVLGALRVTSELVEDGFTQVQFFDIGIGLVDALHHVAQNPNLKLNVRAMSLNVFRSCWDMLDSVKKEHEAVVQSFVASALGQWMPLFLETIKAELPQVPTEQDEQSKTQAYLQWKGLVTLKVQAVKTLDKVRQVRAAALSPYAMEVFKAIWDELSKLAGAYQEMLVDNERGSKETDGDNLPHTVDYLIVEEIDLLRDLFLAPPVKKELEQQMSANPTSPHTIQWLQELLKLLALFAQIPKEEEGFWKYDPNLYLCEATSLSPNYTPRAACAELAVRGLSTSLRLTSVDAVVFYWQQAATSGTATIKQFEAILFLLTSILRDLDEMLKQLPAATVHTILTLTQGCIKHENDFIRAGSQLLLSAVAQVAGDEFRQSAATNLQTAIQAATQDESDVVKVTCIKVMQDYLRKLPKAMKQNFQIPIVHAVGEFISSHDLRDELEDSDDVKSALIETVRDAIAIDPVSALDNTGALDLFFTLASDAAANIQLFQLSTEAFENIVTGVVGGGQPDAFVRLCKKTIPSLTGAFDIANMTQESALTNLAAELVTSLAQYGIDPLPEGFAAAILPKLNRVLMEAAEPGLLRPATLAVRYTLKKGTAQYLAWSDPATRKSAIEITLTIIDRLLNLPGVEEDAADEVGGLALELVNKAGADKLGTYLMELLRALAFRLVTAERPQFVQSLLMVFANLSIAAPKEVIDFLSEVNINGQSGLEVVLPKWLEKSIEFAGFDEIRENIAGLSKIYALDDPRVKAVGVKGELIIEETGRIKTRSQARKNPDRYTTIPASVKILKILVQELLAATSADGGILEQGKAIAEGLDSDGSDDDGEWEDVGSAGVIDLAGLAAKENLMTDDDSPTSQRSRDDETAQYLVNWFHTESTKPQFQADYALLSDDEKQKLGSLA